MDKIEIRKRWKSVIRSLIASAGTRPDFDATRIHHFRVAFKRFRSYVRLLKTSIRGAKNLSVPKELKYWFQEMGEIRNLQIQLKYIDESFTAGQEPPTAYRNQIADLLTRKIGFLNSGPVHMDHIQIKLKKLGAKLPSSLNRKKGLKFIENRKKRMADAFGKGKTDLALHEIRKMLKDIENVSTLISNNKKTQLANIEARHLIDELGKYQDLRIKLGYLKPQFFKAISEQEKSYLLHLKSRLQALKQRSRTELIGKIASAAYWKLS